MYNRHLPEINIRKGIKIMKNITIKFFLFIYFKILQLIQMIKILSLFFCLQFYNVRG